MGLSAGSSCFFASRWGLVDGPVVGEADDCVVGAVEGLGIARPRLSASLCSTDSSASQRATRRTPFILRQASICDLPRPLKPITAIRMSSLAPTTCPYDLADRPVKRDSPAAVATAAELFRKPRRVRVFFIEFFQQATG